MTQRSATDSSFRDANGISCSNMCALSRQQCAESAMDGKTCAGVQLAAGSRSGIAVWPE